jgi:hypothetical protein
LNAAKIADILDYVYIYIGERERERERERESNKTFNMSKLKHIKKVNPFLIISIRGIKAFICSIPI